ncbi:MAG: hypothetical protein DRQ55_05600 [Planctomycetota bacterium]|nr:MAG: hypothetical protein DRQ55_05600 [Planctomycetota bacterium]
MGSLVAGLTFGFFGYGVVFLLWPHSNVSCLLPWLVLVSVRAVQHPSGRRLVALALVCALQHLGGHPETALLSQLTAFALSAAAVREHVPDLAAALRRMAWVAAGFVLGALLAGPQLVPLVEYLLHSDALATRSGQHAADGAEAPVVLGFLACLSLCALAGRRLSQAHRAILPWAALLSVSLVVAIRVAMAARSMTDLTSLLAADWMGAPQRLRVPVNYIEGVAAYAGPALALAAVALMAGGNRRTVRTWTCLGLLALLLRGRAPGLQELVQSLPVVSLMPSARAALVLQLAVAMLAALGYDALRRPLADKRFRARYLAWVGVPVLVAFASMAWATADGALGAGNVLPIPKSQKQRLRVDLAPASPLADGPAVFRGTFDAIGEVQKLRVHWSRRALPIEARFWRQHAPGPRGDGRYNFEVELPGERLPAVTATLRVEVVLQDGRRLWSRGLSAEASLGTIVSSVPVLPRDGNALPQLLLFVGLGLGAAMLAGRPRAPHALLSLVVLAGVPWFTDAQLPRTPRERFWPDSPALEFVRQVEPDGRVLTFKSAWLSGPSGYYGIPMVLGYDALVPIHTAALLRAALAPGSEGMPFKNLPQGFQPDDRLLDLLAASASLGPASDFRVFFYDGYERGQRMEVFVNETALPRARLVPRARIEPDQETALALLLDPEFDLINELVLAAGEPLNSALPAGQVGRTAIVVSEPDRVRVDVSLVQPAYLLLADSYFPGWVALVDGEPRPIRRADVALRAVKLEPGDRQVEFRYEPGSWRLGLALAALGLLACLGALLLKRDRPGVPHA